MTLTGRYKFEPLRAADRASPLVLMVEETDHNGGFGWRSALPSDLKNLAPEIRDGWRFREERDNHLDPIDGRRY